MEDALRRRRDALNAEIAQLERDKERWTTDAALTIKPHLDILTAWLLSTSELKDFYEMPDEATYTHPLSTEARGDHICLQPPRGPRPPS